MRDQLDKVAGFAPLVGERQQPPKSLSLTDPSASLTSKGKSKIAFAYVANYLIDTKAAVIVDVEASPARGTAEVQPASQKARRRHGLWLRRQSRMAGGSQDRAANSDLDRTSQTNGMFTRNDFTYDRAADAYICPGGKSLHRACERDNGVITYRAQSRDCTGCALKAQCTRAAMRSLSVNTQDVRQYVAALAKTEEFKKSAFACQKGKCGSRGLARLNRSLAERRLRIILTHS